MSFTPKPFLKLKSNTFISQAVTQEQGCVKYLSHSRDPAAEMASKSPETTSRLSVRHHPSCPEKKCDSFYKSSEIFRFQTQKQGESSVTDKATNRCLGLIIHKNCNTWNSLLFFFITELITFTWSCYWNSNIDEFFPTVKYYQMLTALLLLPFIISDP